MCFHIRFGYWNFSLCKALITPKFKVFWGCCYPRFRYFRDAAVSKFQEFFVSLMYSLSIPTVGAIVNKECSQLW